MISYHVASATIAIVLAGTIIWLVRHNRLNARTAVSWLAIAVVVAILGVLPQVVDFVGLILGIHYPPILALLGAVALVFLKLLITDIERSKHQRQIRVLAQKVAVLEAQVSTLENGEKAHPVNKERDPVR